MRRRAGIVRSHRLYWPTTRKNNTISTILDEIGAMLEYRGAADIEADGAFWAIRTGQISVTKVPTTGSGSGVHGQTVIALSTARQRREKPDLEDLADSLTAHFFQCT